MPVWRVISLEYQFNYTNLCHGATCKRANSQEVSQVHQPSSQTAEWRSPKKHFSCRFIQFGLNMTRSGEINSSWRWTGDAIARHTMATARGECETRAKWLIIIILLLHSCAFRFVSVSSCSGLGLFSRCHALHVYDSKVLRTPRVFIITNYKRKKNCCSGGVNKHKKVFRVPLPRSSLARIRKHHSGSGRARLRLALPLHIVANLSSDVVAFSSRFFSFRCFFLFFARHTARASFA